jgi:hypothetical protein
MTTPCMLRCSAGGLHERTSRFSGLRSAVDSAGVPTPDLGWAPTFGMTTPCMLRCSAGGSHERTSRFSGLRSPVDSTGVPTPDPGWAPAFEMTNFYVFRRTGIVRMSRAKSPARGAALWALLFMDACGETSGAKARDTVAELMPHLKVRPTKHRPSARVARTRQISAREPLPQRLKPLSIGRKPRHD